MEKVFNGFWAGTLSTSLMTLGLFRGWDFWPRGEKSPLAPAIVTSHVSRKLGFEDKLFARGRKNSTLPVHFAYGIACSIVYAVIPHPLKRRPFLSGSLFGATVWAVNYAGLLPLLGWRGSALQSPPRRNVLLFGAHLLWGASLGFVEHELRTSGKKLLDGRRKSRHAE